MRSDENHLNLISHFGCYCDLIDSIMNNNKRWMDLLTKDGVSTICHVILFLVSLAIIDKDQQGEPKSCQIKKITIGVVKMFTFFVFKK